MTTTTDVRPSRDTPQAMTVPNSRDSGRRKAPAPATSRWMSKRVAIGLTIIAACIVVGVMAGAHSDFDTNSENLIYHTVAKTDLAIDVVERGNLESQQDVRIYCETDDVNGDGIVGTPIVWIIPNGTLVKEGDLLVELDASGHKENLDDQILDTERARSAQLQAQAKYDNQVAQNDLLRADAELDVRIAELELEMFQDPEKGTHQLEIEEIRRQIDDINNEILAAEANLQIKEKEADGIEELFRLGYAGQSEVDRSRLDYLQAESQYTARINKLQTQLATLEKTETFERQIQLLKLQGAVETARRRLLQVERNNESLLAQAEASLHAANKLLEKEEERLAHYQQQVEKCKIYAPKEGMVTYATSQSRYQATTIREGEPVRPRQHILSLPNLKKMQVKTSVHESVLDKVKEGQRVTVRVDAFPERVYQGTVDSVAVLPEQGNYFSSDTKVYKTIVLIDGEVDQLKPGMTAVVEIHVDRLEDVLAVPVQAIVQVGTETWCYVDGGRNGPLRRDVELGRTNDKFVEIVSGLQEGERVVLNPMSLMTGKDRKAADEKIEQETVERDDPNDALEAPREPSPNERDKPKKAQPRDRGKNSETGDTSDGETDDSEAA